MKEEEVTITPKIAERLLLLLIPKRDRDCICGDLSEAYKISILPKCGLTRARLWYWKQVALSICYLFWKGCFRSNLSSIFFGLAVGTIFSLFSWRGNRTPGLVSYFPDWLTALVLLGLTFVAVWICAQRSQAHRFADIWRVAKWISATVGIISGTTMTILCFERLSHPPPFLPVLVLLLTAVLIATFVALIASVLVRVALPRHDIKNAT